MSLLPQGDAPAEGLPGAEGLWEAMSRSQGCVWEREAGSPTPQQGPVSLHTPPHSKSHDGRHLHAVPRGQRGGRAPLAGQHRERPQPGVSRRGPGPGWTRRGAVPGSAAPLAEGAGPGLGLVSALLRVLGRGWDSAPPRREEVTASLRHEGCTSSSRFLGRRCSRPRDGTRLSQGLGWGCWGESPHPRGG